MKKVIYYFSGTGNSLRAAVKIASALGETELISMRNDPGGACAADCDVIGFVYPVYHWSAPEPVQEFIRRLEINPKAYIFAVAMPSFVLGYACQAVKRLLREKGAQLSYAAKVNSVANYVIVYPPMPAPSLVVPKTERRLEKIAGDIKSRRKRPCPAVGRVVKWRYDKVMPQYKQLQELADFKFTISGDCIGCGLCSRVCPCGNIEISDKRPEFLHHCSQCMACVCYCPKRAIGYKIEKEDLRQLEGLKVPVIKLMGLPPKRRRYHNPYITAADLSKSRIYIGGGRAKKE